MQPLPRLAARRPRRTAFARALALAASLAMLGALASPGARAQAQARPTLTVFAAASLRESLDEVARRFQAASGTPVRVSYAASSALARQVAAGAPADVFASADTDWMDWLAARDLVDPRSRIDLLGNRLVLIAPRSSTISLAIAPGMPLAGALQGGRLAVGDPAAVPAGRYARQALASLGVWDQVETLTVRAESVRAALALVARGEAPLGIVYRTDALVEPGVRIVGEFPAGSHAPIVYPFAVVRASPHAQQAQALLKFLDSSEARAIWERRGFAVLP